MSTKAHNRRRGATLTGYGLIVGLIAIIALASVRGIGDNVDSLFGEVSDELSSVIEPGSGTPAETPLPTATPTPTPGPFATLDPASSAPISFSNGNLTATHSASSNSVQGIRSDTPLTNGRYYFEATVGSIYTAVGVANDSWIVGNGTPSVWADYAGTNATGWYTDGNIYGSGNFTSAFSHSGGSILGVAVDADTAEIWFRNGSGWFGAAGAAADPVAGTNGITAPSGTLYPGGWIQSCCFNGATASQTFNFGASAFTYPVPSGYRPGVY